MASERGWTGLLPQVDGYYWMRLNADDGAPTIVRYEASRLCEIGTADDIRWERYLQSAQFLPASPADAEQLSELRKATIEACLKELRQALPLGKIEIRADMTESGQIHVTILNGFLETVPYGPTLGEAMNQARAALSPKQPEKETR